MNTEKKRAEREGPASKGKSGECRHRQRDERDERVGELIRRQECRSETPPVYMYSFPDTLLGASMDQPRETSDGSDSPTSLCASPNRSQLCAASTVLVYPEFRGCSCGCRISDSRELSGDSSSSKGTQQRKLSSDEALAR